MTDFSGSDIALIITATGSFVAALSSAAAVVIGAINTRKVNGMVANVQKIELATNSMKDQLVAATASAEHARGKVEGRADLKAELGAEALAIKKNEETKP